MSILTDLIEHKTTWKEAATQVENWVTSVLNHDQTLAATIQAVESDVKQAASNAVDMADSALGAYIGPAAKAAEAALEGALAAATRGVSLPFNPFITDGIDKIAAAVKAEADAWALKAKATLAANDAASATAQAASQSG
jgi:hypothetical protein